MCLSLLYFSPLAAHAEAEPLTVCTKEPTEMTLSPGDVVDCKIDSAGDQDTFYFNGKANEVFVVSLYNKERDCSSYDPCPIAKVYAPGSSVAIATIDPGADGDAQEVPLSATGKYTIKVSDSRNDRVAPYHLGLERLFPASPNAQQLVYGDFSGNQDLDPVPDQDIYTFTAYQGSEISLAMADVTSDCSIYHPCPQARLFAPDQTLVTSLSATDSETLTLPQEGIYTLRVYEYQNNDKEKYNLQLECLTPAEGKKSCEVVDAPTKPTCKGLTPTILGTDKSETLRGTNKNDVIAGLGGNDRILGRGGDDIICGNSDQSRKGSDTLLGGNGNDTLIGATGSVLFGEEGNDILTGGKGRDFLFGGFGNDKLNGQGGDDVVIGGPDNDVTRGGTGRNDICDNQDDLKPKKGCEIIRNP